MSTTFAGLKVEGDITSAYRNDTPQISKEEFEHLVVAALSAPGVVGLKWVQYTPYFNDGEACTFRAYMDYSGGVRLSSFGEDEEIDDGAPAGYITPANKRLIGGTERHYRGYDPVARETKYEDGETFERHPAADAVSALAKTIGLGAADAVLQDVFGDHATVTVTRSGISVDYYEHD